VLAIVSALTTCDQSTKFALQIFNPSDRFSTQTDALLLEITRSSGDKVRCFVSQQTPSPVQLKLTLLSPETLATEFQKNYACSERQLGWEHAPSIEGIERDWMYKVSCKEASRYHFDFYSETSSDETSFGSLDIEASRIETLKYLEESRKSFEKDLGFIAVYSGGQNGRSVRVTFLCPAWKRLGIGEPQDWRESIRSIEDFSDPRFEILAESSFACKFQKFKKSTDPDLWDLIQVSDKNRSSFPLDPIEVAHIMLREAHKDCLHHYVNGWDYKFCIDDSIIQSRKRSYLSKDAKTGESRREWETIESHVLGKLLPSKRNLRIVSDSKDQSIYVSETYVNGDTCTSSRKPRSVEIQYCCFHNHFEDHQRGAVISIKELKKCSYQMIVELNGFCELMYLKKFSGSDTNSYPSLTEAYSGKLQAEGLTEAKAMNHEDVCLELETYRDISKRNRIMFKSKRNWMYSVSPQEVSRSPHGDEKDTRSSEISLGTYDSTISTLKTIKYLEEARDDPAKEIAHISIYSGGCEGRSATVKLVCPVWNRLGMNEPMNWHESVISLVENPPLHFEIVAEFLDACKFQRVSSSNNRYRWDFVRISSTTLRFPSHPIELALMILRKLEGRCFFKFDSYWAYRFCHGKSVSQYLEGSKKKYHSSASISQYRKGMRKEDQDDDSRTMLSHHVVGKLVGSKRNLRVSQDFGPRDGYISETLC